MSTAAEAALPVAISRRAIVRPTARVVIVRRQRRRYAKSPLLSAFLRTALTGCRTSTKVMGIVATFVQRAAPRGRCAIRTTATARAASATAASASEETVRVGAALRIHQVLEHDGVGIEALEGRGVLGVPRPRDYGAPRLETLLQIPVAPAPVLLVPR